MVSDIGAQQKIIFSKPADNVEEKANSFMPPSSHRSGGAGSFNAPTAFFKVSPADSYDVLPGSPAANTISPDEARRWKKTLDARKNWTLLTPEEILGVPTPEKILGLTDPKINEKLSAEERFLLRQTHGGASNPATNRQANAALMRSDSPDNPFRQQTENDRAALQNEKPKLGSTEYFNQLLKAAAGNLFSTEQKADTAWNNPFTQPAPVPKVDLEQVAAMDRFRALMDSPFPQEKTGAATHQPPSIATPNPNLQPVPLFNPAGRSYMPLRNGISKPTGITPLPGITSPYSLPAAKPSGLAKPPPWLSDSPAPAFGVQNPRPF
ncbi:MAG: hypothetical protein WCH99_03830 [Verrucomicrobiota bacterium]